MRTALGTMLGNLSTTAQEAPDVRFISPRELRPLPDQPRRSFNPEAMEELVRSVRDQGILTPLLVRPAGGSFEIVAGERRWRAATAAGLDQVPVVVRDLTEAEARRVALVENVQREDLNPVDRVDATAHLVAEVLGLSMDVLPARLSALRRQPEAAEVQKLEQLFAGLGGSWTSFYSNLLPVLRYPPDVLEAIRGGLEYTKGALIAREAQVERRTHLLELARKGASLSELRAARTKSPDHDGGEDRNRRIIRALSSKKVLSSISEAKRKRAERLLAELDELLSSS
ncbi:ParB/RepB/Spo0J family partition protein [Deinococcus hopiensis]|uniref:ParB/RepB/Spo0J family partition protein n=1 Tax=Deinococcus hopiensis TaxID=309885 RepID=UPI000A039432|nr:ParB/RepB/Spo0J family partition protein [Deinococcus hopiensis]